MPVITLQISDTARHGTARHGTARQDTARTRNALSSCTFAVNLFLEELLFPRTKVVPINGFLFLNIIILQVRVPCLQTYVLHFVTLPCFVHRNSSPELRRGHKHSLQCGRS